MSHLFGATDLVVPFEHLRMTDVESVGGKNASLGEMISQLAATGVERAQRYRAMRDKCTDTAPATLNGV